MMPVDDVSPGDGGAIYFIVEPVGTLARQRRALYDAEKGPKTGIEFYSFF